MTAGPQPAVETPRIVLCRHGATDHNLAGRFLSRSDPPLGIRGREQCEKLARELAGFSFERCISSPMLRCLQTREIVVPATPFRVDDALREIDFGAWEGKTLEWVEQHAPDELERRRQDPARFRPPEGENFMDVAERLQDLAAELQRSSGVLVVAHRGTLGVLERLLRGLPIDSRAVTPLEPAEFRPLG